ncbi:HAUS augmin-like complex subunit 3 [Watersipora subatra]|uniref:HAUS augmin-like complex subunit 3 n=1 Tax=Watersipora subatra TaxID=2589382 RepID=UPI00355C2B66
MLSKLNLSDDCQPKGDADIEWMWADEQCAQLLDWLTDHVDRENVVTQTERRQYELLAEQGLTVSSSHLEHALNSTESPKHLSEDYMDERIDQMEKELEELNSRRARMKQISTDMRQRLSQARVRSSKIENNLSSLEKDLKKQTRMCENVHEKFQQQLTSLKSTVEQLHSVYATSGTTKLTCNLDLTPLYDAEQSYTVSLAKYTDMKFSPKLSSVTGEIDETYYQLLNLSDPRLLTLRRDSSQTFKDSVLELGRLQKAQPISLKQNIQARVNLGMCKEGYEALMESKSTVEELSKMTDDSLRKERERSADRLSTAKKELAAVQQGNLDALVDQSCLLKEAYILTGDYNLKLARQQYFLDCQQQVIQKLVEQRARNELLTLMLDIEKEGVQETRHLLTSITSYLERLETAGKQQLNRLEDAEMISKTYDRTVIDSRDVLLNTMDKLLDEGEEQSRVGKVFTSYEALAASAHKFANLHREKTTLQFPTHAIQQIQKTNEACKDQLLGNQTHGSLLPEELSLSLSELKVELKLLESNIKTIMSTITLKRKLLNG